MSNTRVIKEYQFRNSHGFKGFKRIRLTANREAKGDIPITDILIRELAYDDGVCFQVFADGKHIGTSFVNDEKQEYLFDQLRNGNVEKAHIKIESETVIGMEKGLFRKKMVSEQRPVFYLFFKVKA